MELGYDPEELEGPRGPQGFFGEALRDGLGREPWSIAGADH